MNRLSRPRWIKLTAVMVTAQLISIMFAMIRDFATERHVYSAELGLFVHSILVDDLASSCLWTDLERLDSNQSNSNKLSTENPCAFLLFIGGQWARLESATRFTQPTSKALERPFLYLDLVADQLSRLDVAPKLSPPALETA